MSELQTTVPVRLYPTPEQVALLRAHCQEYITTINALVAALDSDVLPNGGRAPPLRTSPPHSPAP
jgi:hypothetical protein